MNLGRTTRRLIGTAAMSAVLAALLSPSLQAQDVSAEASRGKAVYERHCLACHGAGGWGDGPQAPSLKVAPANFHRALSFLKSDEDLLRIIESGVVFSSMHSWQGKLSEGEREDVVAYIRLLSQQGQKSVTVR